MTNQMLQAMEGACESAKEKSKGIAPMTPTPVEYVKSLESQGGME